MVTNYRVKVVNRKTGKHLYNYGGYIPNQKTIMDIGNRSIYKRLNKPIYMSKTQAIAIASKINRTKLKTKAIVVMSKIVPRRTTKRIKKMGHDKLKAQAIAWKKGFRTGLHSE